MPENHTSPPGQEIDAALAEPPPVTESVGALALDVAVEIPAPNPYRRWAESRQLLDGSTEEAHLAAQIEAGRYASYLLALANRRTRAQTLAQFKRGLLTRARVLATSRIPPEEADSSKKTSFNRPKYKELQPSNPEQRGKIHNASFEYGSEVRRGRARTARALLRRAKALTPGEKNELTELAKQGAAARQRYFEGNVRLVVIIADEYRNRAEWHDIVQEGNVGLLKAIDKFDFKTDYKFSTYASWWIRQGISRYVANAGRTIAINPDRIEDLRAIKRSIGPLFTKLRRLPTYAEIATELSSRDVSIETIKCTLRADQLLLALDAVRNSENNPEALGQLGISPSRLVDEAAAAAIERVENIETGARLAALAPSVLGARELLVVSMICGLPPYPRAHTQAEIATHLEVTRPFVSQIFGRVKRKLRQAARDTAP